MRYLLIVLGLFVCLLIGCGEHTEESVPETTAPVTTVSDAAQTDADVQTQKIAFDQTTTSVMQTVLSAVSQSITVQETRTVLESEETTAETVQTAAQPSGTENTQTDAAAISSESAAETTLPNDWQVRLPRVMM